MAIYLIYERDNGRIVHTHVQPEDMPIDREGLLALLDRHHDTARLATVLIDPAEIKEDYAYRVDPKTRELQQVDSNAGGSGMGAVNYVKSDWPTGPMKVTYSRGEVEDRQKR
jgi:hypothetical protein